MKTNFLFLMSFVTILMASCSQNDDLLPEDNTESLAQVEMTYEQYFKGYTMEEVMAPKDEITPSTTPETVADDEMVKLIQDSLEHTYSKTRVSTRAYGGSIYPFMGVFKVKTCGNFPEIRIFMDCEDGGWTNIENGSKLPGTWVDKNHNIWMSFCMIMADRYDFIPFRTGGLYFVGGNAKHIVEDGKNLCKNASGTGPGGLYFLEREHDNEDSDNRNEFLLDNTHPAGTNYGYNFADVFSDFCPRPTYAGERNTLLTWIVNMGFPIKQFKPGFSYGVLSLDKTDIKISIDDENKHNKNRMTVVQWGYGDGYWRNPSWTNSGKFYDNIIDKNTFYYVKIIN